MDQNELVDWFFLFEKQFPVVRPDFESQDQRPAQAKERLLEVSGRHKAGFCRPEALAAIDWTVFSSLKLTLNTDR